jgi:hypothetical protein
MKKIRIKKKNKNIKKTNKMKELTAIIFCKNKQIKQYHVVASKKFNIEDETYVVKRNCCYLMEDEMGKLHEYALYYESNPNPFNLDELGKNDGLTENEIDAYIGADLFNILNECQQIDKSKYMIHLVIIVFGLSVIEFITYILG